MKSAKKERRKDKWRLPITYDQQIARNEYDQQNLELFKREYNELKPGDYICGMKVVKRYKYIISLINTHGQLECFSMQDLYLLKNGETNEVGFKYGYYGEKTIQRSTSKPLQ